MGCKNAMSARRFATKRHYLSYLGREIELLYSQRIASSKLVLLLFDAQILLAHLVHLYQRRQLSRGY